MGSNGINDQRLAPVGGFVQLVCLFMFFESTIQYWCCMFMFCLLYIKAHILFNYQNTLRIIEIRGLLSSSL